MVIVKIPRLFDNPPKRHNCYSLMNNDFDWRLVRSLLAALDRGSLLGAARALNISQPTMGRHIAELEAQLGVVLFERSGRGVKPTAMALRLANAARTMEEGANQLQRCVSGAAEETTGTVRITASQPVACVLLPPVLAQMRLTLPDIQVELVSSNDVTNLLRREADIALRMVQPAQASLIARKIGKVTLGAYAHSNYLRRRGTPRILADLASHDLITGDRNKEIIKGLAAQGLNLTAKNFTCRTDDLVAYWHAVRAGLGVGFVADYLARHDTEILPLLPMLKIPPLPMWLTVHREVRTSKLIRAVYDFLAQAVPKAL
jgi:DNA-binding transcriptional LysR family regulator